MNRKHEPLFVRLFYWGFVALLCGATLTALIASAVGYFFADASESPLRSAAWWGAVSFLAVFFGGKIILGLVLEPFIRDDEGPR